MAVANPSSRPPDTATAAAKPRAPCSSRWPMALLLLLCAGSPRCNNCDGVADIKGFRQAVSISLPWCDRRRKLASGGHRVVRARRSSELAASTMWDMVLHGRLGGGKNGCGWRRGKYAAQSHRATKNGPFVFLFFMSLPRKNTKVLGRLLLLLCVCCCCVVWYSKEPCSIRQTTPLCMLHGTFVVSDRQYATTCNFKYYYTVCCCTSSVVHIDIDS